jgi:hypothetical protein
MAMLRSIMHGVPAPRSLRSINQASQIFKEPALVVWMSGKCGVLGVEGAMPCLLVRVEELVAS